jgi:[citrate (pro-3S)-lyase] ligase
MLESNLQIVNLKNEASRREVNTFLESFGLKLDVDVDYTIVLRDESGTIKGTCSKAGNVFKCFAISEDMRGEGLTATLITNLIDKMFEEGKLHSFVFTKPDKVNVFASLNFKLIYEVKGAALLEYGMYGINKSLGAMAEKYDIKPDTPKGAIVMNCNPFTLGHRYLIEEASKSCSEVLVFLVEEDRSVFPFDARFNLVKEGVSDLKNVKVIPGGEYIISSATFPTYFIRSEDERHKVYAELDAGIFAKYFCSRFSIKKRFVGTEPYSISTSLYNDALKKILPENGIEFIEIERKKSEQEYISASKVRKLLKEENIEAVKPFVPKVTYDFLNTEIGRKVIDKLR